MNVRQLIELLSEMNPGDEVRIATQPTYPLAFHIAGVAALDDDVDPGPVCECGAMVEIINQEAHHLDRSLDDDHEPSLDESDEDGLEPGIVWIAAGGHPDHPYAPSAAFEQAQRW